jgi:PadR family transcriptional regulator, regulatory protein PadR
MEDQDPNIKKFQKEMTTGISALVLLSVVSLSEKPLYGYQITKTLESGKEAVAMPKLGALYPVLRSLEKNDLLTSRVEPSFSGPPRRYYSITPQGKATLEEWKKIWSQTSDFVDAILAGSKKK